MRFSLKKWVGADWKNKRYVLAVSGGVDSMAMLELFLSHISPSQLVVAHFNHRVRRDSRKSQELVRQFAQSRGVAFETAPRVGEKVSEAALRHERRAFLESVRQSHGMDWIVTAHHAEDQLETLLMRLIRGTSIQGLSGIRPVNGAWLRPFLEWPKAHLEAIANDARLPVHLDSTNQSRKYFRNQVRQDLIPAFLKLTESHGGPTLFAQRLSGLTQDLAVVASKQRRNVRAKVASLVKTDYWYRLSEDAWESLTQAERATFLRETLEELSGTAPTRRGIEQFIKQMKARTKRLQGQNKIEMLYSCGQFYLQSEAQRMRQSLWIAQVEAEISRGELRLARPGDRYRGKKLKELLLKRRVPRPERRLLPVIALPQSSEVIWYFSPH